MFKISVISDEHKLTMVSVARSTLKIQSRFNTLSTSPQWYNIVIRSPTTRLRNVTEADRVGC